MNELFDNTEEWKNEWKGMPEFTQEKKNKPYKELTVRFRNMDDLKRFSELINQKLTFKTKSIWFPEISRGLDANKIYINEE